MTWFHPLPTIEDGVHYTDYGMNTVLAAETNVALETIIDLTGESPADIVGHVLKLSIQYDDLRATGGFLMADADRPVVLTPPAEEPLRPDEACVDLRVMVYSQIKPYLDPKVNTEDDYDLVGFWRSAFSFYGDVHERQLGTRGIYQVWLGDEPRASKFYLALGWGDEPSRRVSLPAEAATLAESETPPDVTQQSRWRWPFRREHR